MSRAFVKETDAHEYLPDRPLSPHRNFVTEAGLAAIEEVLNRYEAELREAAAAGNGPAIAAVSREVRYWKSRRATAEVVKPADHSRASFGAVVRLRRSDGLEQRFRIVGEDEADPARGSLSYVSPLARALANRQAGESFEFAGEEVLLLDVC